MHFLDNLNEIQRKAVVATEGPSLIVAGAGSGKTRVLTYRIAYMLQQGIPAGQIMALTFTNKAAREMKERILKLVPAQDARYLTMGTFHSVCVHLIRPYADKLGYTSAFTIYDTADSKSLIKAICKERGLDEKIYKSSAVLGRISMAKNRCISPAQYGANQHLLKEDREARMYELATVYSIYQSRLIAANAMDFDDILINMLRLMDTCPEACDRYQQQFKYILVDEYQDTNYVQYLLVNRLAQPQQNICVVGDDAQSIYSFRGADISNILNFQRQYPQARLFKLERNYRSTQNIVNAANSLIHNNIHQIKKNVYSEGEEGSPLGLKAFVDDRTEATGIVEMIMREKRNTTRNLSYEDIAVLYRTNAQSRAFEGELRKNNIPYRIYGGTSFYQRKEIKDTLAYFRLAVNPKDNEALLRALTFPSRGIGDTTMKKVTLCAIENNQSYLEVMRHPDNFPLDMSGPMRKKISAFAAMIDEMAVQSEEMDAFRFAEMLLKQTGLTTALMMDRTTEGIDRAQNVQELLNAIREFVTQRANEGIDYTPITDFLSEVSLMTDQDDNQADTTNRVTLMTVHAAKGLEFPVVYIVGLEENLFPSQFCTTQYEIEEERRLFYVAITRAMQTCVVSYARQRFRNGQITFNSPSRFLNDIDRAYMQILKNNPQPSTTRWGANTTWSTPFRSNSYEQPTTTRTQAAQPQPSTPTRTTTNQVMPIESIYSAGERIEHKVFGAGTVNRVYRDLVTENDKIEIAFDKVGTKTLLLSHAKLERL